MAQLLIVKSWKPILSLTYFSRFVFTSCAGSCWGHYRSDAGNTDSKPKTHRPTGGGRPFTNESAVYQYNNWDNVEWDEEQELEARKKVECNSTNRISSDLKEKYEKEANQFWDGFYSQHQNRFFKDRHWLFTEFPELAMQGKVEPSTDSHVTSETFPGQTAFVRMLEVGCGVGNTVFPVLQTNNDPKLFMYCCDLSETAIHLVKENKDYDPGRCHAFVCDISDPKSSVPFPDGSLDVIILIFVLSAIHPEKMSALISRLQKFLKSGGLVVFRDYGRYDLTQLRFKNGRCLEDNFYVRGDGTRVYFFTQDELRDLFTRCGLVEEQNLVDRRLQVNRGRQLKMYRVWIQCKYRKPSSDLNTSSSQPPSHTKTPSRSDHCNSEPLFEIRTLFNSQLPSGSDSFELEPLLKAEPFFQTEPLSEAEPPSQSEPLSDVKLANSCT